MQQEETLPAGTTVCSIKANAFFVSPAAASDRAWRKIWVLLYEVRDPRKAAVASKTIRLTLVNFATAIVAFISGRVICIFISPLSSVWCCR